jgi:outer membrane protein assembly factor BamB
VQLTTLGAMPTSRTLPPGYGDDDYVDPLTAPDPAALLVTTAGAGGATAAVDPATGKDLANHPGALNDDAATVGHRVVSDRTDVRWDPAAKGCELSVTGADVRTGAVRWTASVGQWKAFRSSTAPECGGAWRPTFIGGRLLVSTVDERPQVRDVETGAAMWTGDPGSYALALAGDVVLVRADHGLGELSGIDVASGRKLWTAPSPGGTSSALVTNRQRAGVGNRFILVDAAGQLRAFDARTGALRWSAVGANRLLGTGSDAAVASEWSDLATAQPIDVRLYRL